MPGSFAATSTLTPTAAKWISRVVAPALTPTPFDQATGNVDRAIAQVEQWLPLLLEDLRRSGLEVEGWTGDSNPIVAIEDALRAGPSDEILIVSAEGGGAAWLEQEMFDRARASFEQPISHLLVDEAGGLAEVARSGPGRDPVSRWRLLRGRVARGKWNLVLITVIVGALAAITLLVELLLRSL